MLCTIVDVSEEIVLATQAPSHRLCGEGRMKSDSH
ncbi:unnamed protein product [Amoebophrya sp. A120]|nr:unnamed protein product [Amoebophrya sp. A120]|eukprot:GSA120T00020207001.1